MENDEECHYSMIHKKQQYYNSDSGSITHTLCDAHTSYSGCYEASMIQEFHIKVI